MSGRSKSGHARCRTCSAEAVTNGAGAGEEVALIVLALVFSTSHGDNPDMHGATLVRATVELFPGAVLLGLACLRTRSLALPIGLHFGWNWALGHVLGFGVSGFEHAGWFRPLLQDRPEWMTGGRFGPEASLFAVIVDVLLIALLWRWKGSAPRLDAAGANRSPVRSRVSAAAASSAAPLA